MQNYDNYDRKPSKIENYYERLGISRIASHDEIRGAYRQFAMKYHPDRNPKNKDAETQFKAISEAYSTLNDSLKRAQYDAAFETIKQEPSRRSVESATMNDVFKAFYGILREGFKECFDAANKPKESLKKTIDVYI